MRRRCPTWGLVFAYTWMIALWFGDYARIVYSSQDIAASLPQAPALLGGMLTWSLCILPLMGKRKKGGFALATLVLATISAVWLLIQLVMQPLVTWETAVLYGMWIARGFVPPLLALWAHRFEKPLVSAEQTETTA